MPTEDERAIQIELPEGLNEAFAHKFNREGYGFQYAVIDQFARKDNSHANMLFEAAEFPVRTQGRDTKIDFILRPRGTRFFVVAECKRANPAFARWCFVKAPYVHQNRSVGSQPIVVESIMPEAGGGVDVSGYIASHSLDVYDLSFVVKTDAKGDGKQDNDAIEIAVSQAFRGVYGLIEVVARGIITHSDRDQAKRRSATIMPVLFTTAELWVSDIDISKVDINNGRIDPSDIQMKNVDMLYLQYPVSEGLRHTLDNKEEPKEFTDILRTRHLRTITIVNAKGIERFARQFHLHMGGYDKIRVYDWG